MPPDPQITVTRSQLIAALADWERQAQEEEWAQRSDDDRFTDSADYLMYRCREHGAG